MTKLKRPLLEFINIEYYQYIKRLSKQDIRKINACNELSKLDEIIKTIPIMLPIHNPQISKSAAFMAKENTL